MTVAIVKYQRGRTPVFFTGEYHDEAGSSGFFPPIESMYARDARTFDLYIVGQLVADLFNTFHGFETGTIDKPWCVAEMPDNFEVAQ